MGKRHIQLCPLPLQRETLLRQLETNQLDIDATLEELSVQQETEDQNYSMYVSQRLRHVGPDYMEWEGWVLHPVASCPQIGAGAKLWAVPMRQWKKHHIQSA